MIRKLAPFMFAAALLAGCGGNSESNTSSVATGSPAAIALPTMEATPPVIPLDLPQKPIPTGGKLPIQPPHNSSGQRAVKAGYIAETACFKAIVPYEGLARGAGCRFGFGTQTLGAGTAMDVPYFEAQALSDQSPTLDALVKELLDSYAANDAKIEASGTPYERQNLARRGKLGTDKGSYLGMRSATMFGQPARILTWGFIGQGRKMEYVYILTMLPPGRYMAENKPLTALLINGYTSGYQPKLFMYALSHFEML